MPRVRLIHWNLPEAEERAARLRAAGFEADIFPRDPNAGLRGLRVDRPDALIIDLSRVPSHGRSVALAVRDSGTTRDIPIVFVEGDPEKVELIRRLLPDAAYATWRGIRGAITRAIAHPPEHPVKARSRMEGYVLPSLQKKLGIKPGFAVHLLEAPDGIESVIGDLPEGATLCRSGRGPCDLVLWFVDSRKSLERGFVRASSLADDRGLWIFWPKKASAVASDMTQNNVRQTGLDAGWVDFKICSMNEIWSGLLFKKRKTASPRIKT